MTKSGLLTCFFLLLCLLNGLNAQSVGVNSDGSAPDASAMLDIHSTDKGILIPRTDTATVNAAGSPANGLMIYNPGDMRFYYYTGSKWVGMDSKLMDNDEDTGIAIEETADDDLIRFKIAGYEVAQLDSTSLQIYGKSAGTYVGYYTGRNENGDANFNTGFGLGVLRDNTSGQFNVGVGPQALSQNIDGNWNTASGLFALKQNTSGDGNTAYGYRSLDSNTIGAFNVAVGYKALHINEDASENVAIGHLALRYNISGNFNTAVGSQAQRYNELGSENTSVGYGALENNTASGNTGVGFAALMENTNGSFNTAMGHRALADNLTGQFNAAYGFAALDSNTIGQANTALGCYALRANTEGGRNVALGYDALVSNKTGSYNIATGHGALAANEIGSNNTAIGFQSMNDNISGVGNTAIGYLSLTNNTQGIRNTAVGVDASRFNQTGYYNTAIGWGALQKNEAGIQNTAVGHRSILRSRGNNTVALGLETGLFDTLSVNNIFLGNFAGAGGTTNADEHDKSNNVMLGHSSGRYAQGSNNIFLGAHSGENEMGDHKLYIENTNGDSTQALIYGEFDNDLIRLNGKVIMRDGWADADMDTKIEVEQNSDDDKIRLAVEGSEALRIEKNSNGITQFEMATNDFNIFIGQNAGENTSGTQNTGIGHRALFANDAGGANTAVGAFTLTNNTSGLNNSAFGWNALSSNGSGSNNMAIGLNSMSANTTGSNNAALGTSSMRSNRSGGSSVAFGYRAGIFDTVAVNNVYIGANAGAGGNTIADEHAKSNNVMIGYNAGQFAQGSSNVFIGHTAGKMESGDHKLYISNTDAGSNNALIYGEFNNQLFRVNGELNIRNEYSFPETDGLSNQILKKNGSGDLIWSNDNNGYWSQSGSNVFYSGGGVSIGGPAEHFFHVIGDDDGDFMTKIENQNMGTKSSGLIVEVGDDTPGNNNVFVQFWGQKVGGGQSDVGSIVGDGSGGVMYNTTSDRRLKQNIEPFTGGLATLEKIDAHRYEMKANPEQEHIGFIAQELYEVLPNIVKGTPETTSAENPMMVDYSRMTPVLVSAVKELAAKNEALEKEVMDLKKMNHAMAVLQQEMKAQRKMIADLEMAANNKVDSDLTASKDEK